MSTIALVISFMLLIDADFNTADAADSDSMHMGIFIRLDRDFYDALQNRNYRSSGKTYTTDPSKDYLRRIAISSEFAVKTNLEILRQNEEIIRLLKNIQLPKTGCPGRDDQ